MDKEKKDKVKGICGTLLFHALLLFLLSLPFMSLSYEDPPTRKGGGSIAMNFIKQDPPPPKEVSDKVPEEIEMIENKDIITSEEGELEVTDNINENNETPPVEETPPAEEIPPVIELTDQQKAFDKNNDGKIDIEEQKKLDEFLEKIGNVGDGDDKKYNGDDAVGQGNGTGGGKGFGDGLDSVSSHNSIDPATLDCEQGKGTGGLTIQIIRSPYGKIVEFDQTSFKSTLTGFTFSSDQQKERLLDCIKKEYNEAIDKGEKVKIYEKDHLHTLKLDFIN
ncbi:MAG: hypothetical protein HN702_04745 [Flavobacteriales bacterium]|nr:hypothetical protein [Flavobacteriales bacterium]